MILYATKETMSRFKFKTPGELSDPMMAALGNAAIKAETGDRLIEWGAKLFYFDRRKCLQFVNFASKLTIFLIDIKVSETADIRNAIAHYLLHIYKDNAEMLHLLDRYFEESPIICFAPLKDRSIISTLNHTQSDFLWDGCRLEDYIRDGILHTLELNSDINRTWLFRYTVNGKEDYAYAAEQFETLLWERYMEE